MPGWLVFVIDLVVAGVVVFVLEQLARLYRRFRPSGPDGNDGGEPWRYRPGGPRPGPHARGSAVRRPTRRLETHR